MQNRIREIRQTKNLSLKELAELAGISAGYLSQLETGKRQLNAHRIETLSRVLDCNPINIIGGEGVSRDVGFSLAYDQLDARNKKIVLDMISALLASQV